MCWTVGERGGGWGGGGTERGGGEGDREGGEKFVLQSKACLACSLHEGKGSVAMTNASSAGAVLQLCVCVCVKWLPVNAAPASATYM